MAGYGEHKPPTDVEGFETFMETLAPADLLEAHQVEGHSARSSPTARPPTSGDITSACAVFRAACW